jgi:hypothetical protein
MIFELKTLGDDTVGFLCSGRVTKRDYKTVLLPAVQAALAAHPRIRIYYETTPDFSLDAGAVWEDLKLGVEHLTRWERLAVVSDVEWLRHAVRAFSLLMPGRVRLFPSAEARRARAWVVAGGNVSP